MLDELSGKTPEERATILSIWYPTDPTYRQKCAKIAHISLEELDAEEKDVRLELEQYEAQERQRQSEGPGIRMRGRGRGRGEPSRSRDQDPSGGSNFEPF